MTYGYTLFTSVHILPNPVHSHWQTHSHDKNKLGSIKNFPRCRIMKNLWRFLRSPSGTVSVLTLLACGLIAGLVLVFATHQTFKATSTEAFCTSCHTMEQPLVELKQSPPLQQCQWCACDL